jgi:hypothetical protein
VAAELGFYLLVRRGKKAQVWKGADGQWWGCTLNQKEHAFGPFEGPWPTLDAACERFNPPPEQ